MEVKERMSVNIGIDIGKRKCDVCVMDDEGVVLERGQYNNTTSDATKFAKKMTRKYTKCKAACETTANLWYKTFNAFENAGIDITLANAYELSLLFKRDKKTDREDAEKIANTIRIGMIPACYVPPINIRDTRSMVRQRVRLTQDRTRVINRIHSLLDRHEIEINATSMYAVKALVQLKTIKLDSAHDQHIIRQCGRQIEYLLNEIKQIDELLEEVTKNDKYAKLLLSLTGVGAYTAILMASEIGDISRFETPKQMVSWAGLCPIVYQSGKQLNMNRIKKIGRSGLVNWALCEAANSAIRFDDRMKATYKAALQRHAGRHANAIIVVAHKMITIMYHMLKTNTPYESRNAKLYKRKLAKLERKRRK